MSFLYPRDKDTIRNMIRSAIEKMKVPAVLCTTMSSILRQAATRNTA